MSKPSILVARAIFPEVLQSLAQVFDVESNQADEVWSAAELTRRMQGKVGALTTGSERIDAALLQANPQLRIVANMASQTGSPQTFNEITARYGLTEAEVEWGVRLQILSQKAYAKQVEKQVPTLDAQVKVEHILLLTMNQPGPDGKPLSPEDQKKKEDEQRKRLEGIVADVKAGKMTFEDAAKKYSDDKASGAEGGALPWFGRTGMMVPEFETAAFNLAKEGEISPLVKTQYGFHVLKLIKRGKEATAAEKAKFKAEEIKKLTTTGSGMQQWLQGLVQKATITLNPPAVNVKK